jgi:hypothetical protein
MNAFKTLIAASAETVPVLREHFQTAERLCLHEATGCASAG